MNWSRRCGVDGWSYPAAADPAMHLSAATYIAQEEHVCPVLAPALPARPLKRAGRVPIQRATTGLAHRGVELWEDGVTTVRGGGDAGRCEASVQ